MGFQTAIDLVSYDIVLLLSILGESLCRNLPGFAGVALRDLFSLHMGRWETRKRTCTLLVGSLDPPGDSFFKKA